MKKHIFVLVKLLFVWALVKGQTPPTAYQQLGTSSYNYYVSNSFGVGLNTGYLARLHVKGVTSDGSTNTFYAQNANGTDFFRINTLGDIYTNGDGIYWNNTLGQMRIGAATNPTFPSTLMIKKDNTNDYYGIYGENNDGSFGLGWAAGSFWFGSNANAQNIIEVTGSSSGGAGYTISTGIGGYGSTQIYRWGQLSSITPLDFVLESGNGLGLWSGGLRMDAVDGDITIQGQFSLEQVTVNNALDTVFVWNPLTKKVMGRLSSTIGGGGTGTVTSVSGTSNRVTVTSPTTTPVIDISSSYVGQASITTLGTIATGVWNGTAIANANLANSSLTIGSTNISLGATSTTLAGLSSVTSTSFVGALTGNASTVTTNANLTGPITSVGNATSIAAQTGTGTTFVMQASPTLTTPVLGIASATSISHSTAANGIQSFTTSGITIDRNVTGAGTALAITLTHTGSSGAGLSVTKSASATSADLAQFFNGSDKVMTITPTGGIVVARTGVDATHAIKAAQLGIGATGNLFVGTNQAVGDVFYTNINGKFSLYGGAAPTNGQLLMGNTAGGTFDAGTLTMGNANLAVTNGAASITLTPSLTPSFTSGVFTSASNNALTVGTASGAYRTTNGGTGLNSMTMIDMSGSNSVAGSLAIGFDVTNQMYGTIANGTRRVALWGISATNTVTTAGSESGDLSLSTKATGAAMTPRLVVTSTGGIYGTAIHNNATSPTGTTNQAIASGTFTPTLTNVTNVAASTAYQCQWIRVGNVVTVSGKVDIDATAAGATELGLSLPLASNMTTEQNCGGTASSSAAAGLSTAVRADATNDRAAFVFTATSITNDSYFFHFQYLIL